MIHNTLVCTTPWAPSYPPVCTPHGFPWAPSYPLLGTLSFMLSLFASVLVWAGLVHAHVSWVTSVCTHWSSNLVAYNLFYQYLLHCLHTYFISCSERSVLFGWGWHRGWCVDKGGGGLAKHDHGCVRGGGLKNGCYGSVQYSNRSIN